MPPPDLKSPNDTASEGPHLCVVCNVYDCERPRPGIHDWMTQRAIRHLRAEYPEDFSLAAPLHETTADTDVGAS